MKVLYNDLYSQYLSIRDEIDEAISEVISSSSFIRGKFVSSFEKQFANVLGIRNCISCANGTDAIFLALKGLDVKCSDEVIVPAHSWISSSETITQAGAKIVFCDTDEQTFVINAPKIEEKITAKTVGIVVVHLFGQPARMNEIKELADKKNLWIIEDCAQAHLAKFKGNYVGSYGKAGTFSFYPGKNLGAMGDAGCLVTNDTDLGETVRMYANHGSLKKHEHIFEGINSRLDGIQAAILAVKLRYLKDWTAKRKVIASRYNEQLRDIPGIETPTVDPDCEPVWHCYVIKTPKRDELRQFLLEKGIQTIINYPTALPFLKAYKHFNHSPEDFPCSYANQSLILSLPIYPEMHENHISYVSENVRDFFNK